MQDLLLIIEAFVCWSMP